MDDETADRLRAHAMAVLDANRVDGATRPGPELYPHQWSWDAGFIAIGLAHVDVERARGELRSLLGAQWRNGMVPHIAFQSGFGAYFPGPETWRIDLSGNAPDDRATSGIVQPPIHATAAWRIHLRSDDEEASLAFLREVHPKLRAWHDYLYRERDAGGTGLVAIRHPWESGEDDSPAWDSPLANIPLGEHPVPEYRRVDLTMVAAHERPTRADYDYYVLLVECFKRRRYDEAAMREHCPFAVEDVLFNVLLVRSGEDLAAIAEVIGEDPTVERERAARTAAALDERLWSENAGCYVGYDRREGRQVSARLAAGFTPLFAGVPSDERAARMVPELTSVHFWPPEGSGVPVASYDRLAPAFEPRRYWRGPVWVNINWLLWEGLRRYGYERQAAELRDRTLWLVADQGFFEYFDPLTREGLGSPSFSWTAALVLDLLAEG
jgi:glycogen debranching enzyme